MYDLYSIREITEELDTATGWLSKINESIQPCLKWKLNMIFLWKPVNTDLFDESSHDISPAENTWTDSPVVGYLLETYNPWGFMAVQTL